MYDWFKLRLVEQKTMIGFLLDDWLGKTTMIDFLLNDIFEQFLPEASFGLRVLSLPASVCLCVSVCVCVRQPRACPRHKSPRIQARTTKFGQKVQNNLVKVPIVLGGDWPWPSRSNLTWKAKFTPFWACPRHNSPSIQTRTTKFGQKMQTNLLVVHVVLGGAIDCDLHGQI